MNEMNRMRCMLAAAIAIAAVCFTSCVDYTQSISLKDGKYIVYIKFTLSKALLAMAEEDADEWADKLIADDDFKDGFSKVSTDLEVGAQCTLKIDPKTKNKDEKAIIPSFSKNKVLIPFLPNTAAGEFDTGDEDGNDMMMAILSTAKCRVLVSKQIISDIDTAYFEGNAGQNYSIAVFDYGDTWGIEVPLIVLMSSNYKTDNIIVIRR